MNPKRILIFSASYGSGHVQAANAYVSQFEHLGVDAVNVDMLKLLPRILEEGLRLPYTELAKRNPKLWGVAYYAMRRTWILHRYHRSIGLLAHATKKKILEAIESYTPDFIICTHPSAAHLLDALKKRGFSIPPYYVQITDYGYHPLWRSSHTSGYLLSTADMIEPMLQDGIQKQILHLTGIPVRTAFTQIAQTPTLPHYGIHYLVMTGGFGLVDPRDIIHLLLSLPETTNVTVITGKSNLLRNTLSRVFRAEPRVSILGWVSDIATRMHTADIIVTKPGGMTTTEALTLKKPIVYYDPLPGQETDNVLYLERHNLACSSEHLSNIKHLTAWHEAFDITKLPFLTTELEDPY